jgi:hypothetical protein
MTLEPAFLETVIHIHDRLADTAVLWVVTGSLGMALQGVPVAVHDIDLQTDAAGAYEIGRMFADHVTRPVVYSAAETIRSHFGVFELNGIRVEIMGDVEKRLENGRWETAPDLRQHRQFVTCQNRQIPVLDLVYECEAYRRLDRPDKVALLQNWLAQEQ